MARDQYTEKRKAQPGHVVASVISVLGALTAYNISRQSGSSASAEGKDPRDLIQLIRDESRAICKELVDNEKERAREKEQELKNTIELLMRYSERRMR